jgi:hypothetical protein
MVPLSMFCPKSKQIPPLGSGPSPSCGLCPCSYFAVASHALLLKHSSFALSPFSSLGLSMLSLSSLRLVAHRSDAMRAGPQFPFTDTSGSRMRGPGGASTDCAPPSFKFEVHEMRIDQKPSRAWSPYNRACSRLGHSAVPLTLVEFGN